MRQGNIMVTFEIPCAYDKPDLNGGTNESVEMTSGIVTGLNISAIGFTTE